jgi:hypothetical protein
MGGILPLGHTFHDALTAFKILELNGNDLLIQLITLAARASLGAGKRSNSAKDDTAMTTKTTPPAKTPSDALLLDIATRHFHSIETLETRNSDRLDFHDVAVWAIRAALEEAFEAGRRTGEATTSTSQS